MPKDVQHTNAQLRHAITHAAGNDAALTAAVYAIAVKQPANPSPEDVQANLQARARAIIELRPDLKVDFEGLLPGI
jgi:hypothetical protein